MNDPRQWLDAAHERADRAASFRDVQGVAIQTGFNVTHLHRALKTDHPAMADALTAVLDRHAPIDHPWGPGCLECNTAYYPCPTIHDINENLEDTP